MTRRAERWEGLAIGGPAEVGPLRLNAPTLLESRSGPEAGDGSDPPSRSVRLVARGEAAAGRRRLALLQGSESIELDIAVDQPEIARGLGRPQEVGPRVQSIHWPIADGAWEELRKVSTDLVVLANARSLFAEGEPFVRAVQELRGRLGASPLLWAPRVALPHRLAMLVYLGVDVVDSTEALWRSAEGEFLTADLGVGRPEPSRSEGACPCPSCQGGTDVADGGHATWVLRAEFRRVRAALAEGRLRELVEARLGSEPLLAEMLRYADRDLADLLEARAPVTGDGVRAYTLRESLSRPEARRFRARFLERYSPPPSKSVLLLVPCSRTKPYRNSPSHRRILRALDGLPNRPRLHVVSVTSPLGLVPQELEDVPPARHYDIPVTGRWDEEERGFVTVALTHLLRHESYSSLLVHLDPEEYGFLRPAVEGRAGLTWTMTGDRTTSAPALDELRRAAEIALAPLPAVEGGPLSVVREELQAIAALQFGESSARALFSPPVRLHGRPWFQRVVDGAGKDLATWREERGLFHLTLPGGERLNREATLEVEIRPEVPLGGDVFAPGVGRADPRIRTGDAVRVVRAGALVAVGEAALPGPLMTGVSHGLAVRLRHRGVSRAGAAATDTALESEGDPTTGRSSSG